MGRRFRFLLLGLILALSLTGTAYASENDVWDDIQALIDAERASFGVLMDDTAEDWTRSAAFFASLSDEVEAIVTAREDYVPGSLRRRGDQVLWRTADGLTKAYTPALRASMAASEASSEGQPLPAVPYGLPAASAAGGELMDGAPHRDVAMFAPFYGMQSNWPIIDYYRVRDLADATGGVCRWITAEDATIDALAECLQTCCFVDISTHGSDSVLTLSTGDGLTPQDLSSYWAYDEGPFSANPSVHMWGITPEAITAHMDGQAPDNFVWIKACSVLGTGDLANALRDKGVGVVFGWSEDLWQSADDELTFFLDSLRKGHTVSQAASDMKRAMRGSILACWNLTEEQRSLLESQSEVSWNAYHPSHPLTPAQAQAVGAAFTVFVSEQDPHPGKSGVNQPQTVRSAWKLPLADSAQEIRAVVQQGSYLEHVFTDADSIRLISGDLPPGVKAETRTYAIDYDIYSSHYASICGAPTAAGLYTATLQLGLKAGGSAARQAVILVTKPKKTLSQESFAFEAGVQQTQELSISVSADCWSAQLCGGTEPDGMCLRVESGRTPFLSGSPAPGHYTPTYRLFFTDGTVVEHTVDIVVSDSVVEVNRTMAAKVGSSAFIPFDIGSGYPTSVEQTGGSLPPGMSWSHSISEAPYFRGVPTATGNYVSRFRIAMPDGRLILYTATIRTFTDSVGLAVYPLDLTSGSCDINDEDFSTYIGNTLIYAIRAGQIRFRQTTAGLTMLDLDRDGNYDIVDGKGETEGYSCLRLLSGASLLGDDYELALCDEAISQLVADGVVKFAKKLKFHLLDRYDLTIAGTQVTSRNRSDVLGDGAFLFDGDRTLTVRGDYYGENTLPVIENGLAGLIIQPEGTVTLYGKGECIRTSASVSIRGSGELALQTSGVVGVLCTDGARLEVQNTTLWVSAGQYGLSGSSTGESLSLDRCTVTIRSAAGAVRGFDGGLWLSRCLVAEPLHASATKPEIRTESGKLIPSLKITPYDTRYKVEVNGIPVTDRNMQDILGDGTFSYDVYGRLTIHCDYEQPEGIPYPVIRMENGGTVVGQGGVTLTAPGTCLQAASNCRVQGGPIAFVSTKGTAVLVINGADLTVFYADMRAEGAVQGIAGSGSGEHLAIEESSLRVKGGDAAASGFSTSNGIFTRGLVTLEMPAGGSYAGGEVLDSGGSPAKEAVFHYCRTFPLRICGESVTEQNMDDIFGNGLFSFDGDRTLTLRASLWSEYGVIESSLPELVIRVEEDISLSTAPQSEWEMSFASPLSLAGNVTITGPGQLTVDGGSNCGINAAYNCRLMLQAANVVAKGSPAVWIPEGGALIVDDSLLALHGEYGAIGGTGAVTLIGSAPVDPDADLTAGSGETDITIGPRWAAVTGGSLSYRVYLPGEDEDVWLLSACYDAAGRQIGLAMKKETRSGLLEGAFAMPAGAAEYRLFVMTDAGTPLIPALLCKEDLI